LFSFLIDRCADSVLLSFLVIVNNRIDWDVDSKDWINHLDWISIHLRDMCAQDLMALNNGIHSLFERLIVKVPRELQYHHPFVGISAIIKKMEEPQAALRKRKRKQSRTWRTNQPGNT
jgi:hypothetical protein